MSSLTAKAIKTAFLKLLNEKPLNRITVKDVVEECGINRNSFYYHYQDLPSLLEEIIMEDADRLIEESAGIESLETCLEQAVHFAVKNKKAAMHIFHSGNRELFYRYLSHICQYMIEQYVDRIAPELKQHEEDRSLLIKYYKCECIGQILEWMEANMSYDIQSQFTRLCHLMNGSAEMAIKRSMEEENGSLI